MTDDGPAIKSKPDELDDYKRLTTETMLGHEYPFWKKHLKGQPGNRYVFATVDEYGIADFYTTTAKRKELVVEALKKGGMYEDFESGEHVMVRAEPDGWKTRPPQTEKERKYGSWDESASYQP